MEISRVGVVWHMCDEEIWLELRNERGDLRPVVRRSFISFGE